MGAIKLVVLRHFVRVGVLGLSMYPKIMKGGTDSTLDIFLDMVAWTVDLIGIDAVGFGTDYYDGWPESIIKWWRAGRFSRESAVPINGFSKWPSWFQSSSDFPNLIAGLERRGFSSSEIVSSPAATGCGFSRRVSSRRNKSAHRRSSLARSWPRVDPAVWSPRDTAAAGGRVGLSFS
jgi:hypothetical protein